MIANFVTCFRILLIPLIIALLLYGQPGQAFTLFLLAALTDGLDGYLARRLNQVTDLGKFLDPLADKILVITVLVVLAGFSLPVIIILLREVLVMWLRSFKAKGGTAMPASWPAKIKTVLQLIAVGMLMLNLPYAVGMLWLAVLVSVISGIEYGWKTR